jgi:hypothetical protein
VEPWPEEVLEDRAGEIAVACASLLTRQAAWRHRRVETLTVLTHEQVRRSVSVDFTVPAEHRADLALGGGQWAVPLALLAKRPLVAFDLVDEEARALPLLRAEENRLISRELLYLVLDDDLQDTEAPDGVQAAVTRAAGRLVERVLADEPADVAREVAELEGGVGLRPGALAAFATFAALLSRAWVMFAVVGDVERRRVVKLAYDEPFTQRPGLVHFYDAPGCTEAASYHVEVAIPSDLKARRTALVDARTGRVLAAGAPRADRPALYYVGDPRDAPAEPGVSLWLGAERSRFLVPAAVVALVITALLALPRLLSDLTALAASAGPAITLVLSTSAVFSALVLRTDEHPLVRLVLVRHRLALLAATLAALAAAATLGFRAPPGVLRLAWAAAALVAAVAAGMLVLAALRAPSARSTPEPP